MASLTGSSGSPRTCTWRRPCPGTTSRWSTPVGRPEWWYDIIDGLPDPIVEHSFIEVWDTPGLGVKFNVAAAKRRLSEEDKDFFD